MKKTVSLLLVAIMLLGVSSAMALPAIGSHPSEGDKGGVRAAIITAAISQGGQMLNQAAIDALGLKFTNHGRDTGAVTSWKGFNSAFVKGASLSYVDMLILYEMAVGAGDLTELKVALTDAGIEDAVEALELYLGMTATGWAITGTYTGTAAQILEAQRKEAMAYCKTLIASFIAFRTAGGNI